MDLETYLIIVPYLSSGSSKLTELFDQTKGIENYKMNKTILVFTHSDVYDDVADMKYNIYRGKITGVSVKGETKRPAKKQTRRSKASPKKKTN